MESLAWRDYTGEARALRACMRGWLSQYDASAAQKLECPEFCILDEH